VTLPPSEVLSAVDGGRATQALLVRTYLSRVRRPPVSRREPHPVHILKPTGPIALPGSAQPDADGGWLESWPTPNWCASGSLPPMDTPLLRRSLESPGATGPTPTNVCSAVAFIEARAADPIGLADIAAAARLSPRALQVAFRKHLGTTPLGHLHAVRMSRVHADLLAARPGDGQTVSTVANRWGFSQLSRFARDYKQRYGVSPRDTLSRSAS
jgi:AraC-like DNA-binding protein